MNKFFNWLFGIKPESKEDQENRIAEINTRLDQLQGINTDLEKKKRELDALNRYLNSR